jgi:hypothetical protein
MRRAACVVLPLPVAFRGAGLSLFRPARRGRRLLVVLGAGIVAIAVAVSLAADPLASKQPVRAAGSSMRLPLAAWGPVSGALGRDDPAYRPSAAGAGFVARNPRQRLRAKFSTAGMSVRSGEVLAGMRLAGYGYGARLASAAEGAPITRANRVVYRDGSLDEWYANGPLGLEQGFTLNARPAGLGAGPLTLGLSLSGNARAVLSPRQNAVTFSVGGSSLSYRGLMATDARGRALPAWLQLHGRELLIRVDDANARYPITIDPFIQQAKLTASDGPGGFLGASAAVSGHTIVAGAPLTTVNGNIHQGAVYVFVKPKNGWAHATQTAELTASDGGIGQEFGGNNYSPPFFGGNAVAISGDTIAVAAPFADVYVFVKPSSGWRDATQTAKLTAANGDPFGSVAIDGSTIVAGAPSSAVPAGAAYVFVKPASGWANANETAQLTSSDGTAGDDLGDAVAISGGTVVAGAPFATAANYTNGDGPGAAYVFTEPSGGWRNETEAARLDASDGVSGDMLGFSVAVSGHTVVAGADDEFDSPRQNPGAAYVFVEPQAGWSSETQTAKLTASDGAPGDFLGNTVAIHGNTVIAGAPFATVKGNSEQGAAYAFLKPTSGWANETQTAKLSASDGAGNDVFATGLGMSGDTVAFGAPGAAVHRHAGQGAVYVFSASSSLQTATVKRTMSLPARARARLR